MPHNGGRHCYCSVVCERAARQRLRWIVTAQSAYQPTEKLLAKGEDAAASGHSPAQPRRAVHYLSAKAVPDAPGVILDTRTASCFPPSPVIPVRSRREESRWSLRGVSVPTATMQGRRREREKKIPPHGVPFSVLARAVHKKCLGLWGSELPPSLPHNANAGLGTPYANSAICQPFLSGCTDPRQTHASVRLQWCPRPFPCLW